jgi:hypothetical protein
MKVARQIDPNDLLDAGEVAVILGLAYRQVVSTYRRRYGDFPEPLISKNSGMCELWLRSDIEDWNAHKRPPTRQRTK